MWISNSWSELSLARFVSNCQHTLDIFPPLILFFQFDHFYSEYSDISVRFVYKKYQITKKINVTQNTIHFKIFSPKCTLISFVIEKKSNFILEKNVTCITWIKNFNFKNPSTENVCLHSLVIYDFTVTVAHFVRWDGSTAAWLGSFGAAAGQAAALLPEFSPPILYSFVSSLIIVPQHVVMATGIFADLRADGSASDSCFYIRLVTPWALAELIPKTFVFLSPQLFAPF